MIAGALNHRLPQDPDRSVDDQGHLASGGSPVDPQEDLLRGVGGAPIDQGLEALGPCGITCAGGPQLDREVTGSKDEARTGNGVDVVAEAIEGDAIAAPLATGRLGDRTEGDQGVDPGAVIEEGVRCAVAANQQQGAVEEQVHGRRQDLRRLGAGGEADRRARGHVLDRGVAGLEVAVIASDAAGEADVRHEAVEVVEADAVEWQNREIRGRRLAVAPDQQGSG